VFLVRYNSSSGARMWTRLLGTASADIGTSIAVDRSSPDAVYIGGYTGNTSGSGLPGTAGGFGGSSDAFVARFASNGTRVWVRQFGTNEPDVCNALAVHQSEIYATGYTDGVMAGSPNPSSRDIFIIRISTHGAVVWTSQLGSTSGSDVGQGIAVDSSGVYVTGHTYSSLSGQPFAGGIDAFVARHTHAGVWAWTRMLGTSTNDLGLSVSLRSNSDVLVAGTTEGNLGGETKIGIENVFVASFLSSGEPLWIRLYDSLGRTTSIAVDSSNGAVYCSSLVLGSGLGPNNVFGSYGQPSIDLDVGLGDLFLLNLQL
jgi:hypothetical protein